jgi:hypothetical protein
MANLGGPFDAMAKENQNPNLIPAGDYDVIAVASEVKDTNDKTGRYLNVQFQITKGEKQNFRLFHKFNLWLTPSPTDPEKAEKTKTAIGIAKGQFSEFCRAVGVLTPSDSSELHNKPLTIKVNVKDGGGGYGPQNNVTKFVAKAQNAPLVTAPAQGSGW